ncbi:MAG: FliH/SctL family protein [Ignavibacteriaceae bacterium]|jgi:flagellar assembly protein FliH
MSSVIRVNAKSKKLNVSMKNPLEKSGIETDKEEVFFQKQLQQYYEKGYSDGQKAASEKLEKDYTDKLAKKFEYVTEIVSDFNKTVAEYDKSFEKIIINIALIIAEKIVQREILQGPIIDTVLKDSLKRVIGSNKILVRLHPSDLEIINQDSGNLFIDDAFSKIKFESDEKIERGGCFIETEIGNVDARISSQFNEMKKQFESTIINDF